MADFDQIRAGETNWAPSTSVEDRKVLLAKRM